MSSQIVFGCLKHRTVATTVTTNSDRIVWVDLCAHNTTLRVHDTDSNEDLLNRRGVVVDLDTTIVPLCAGKHASSTDIKEEAVDSSGHKRRRCDRGCDISSDITSEKAEEERRASIAYINATGGNRRLATGRLPFKFTTEQETVKMESDEPTSNSRGRTRRRGDTRKPGRLICEK